MRVHRPMIFLVVLTFVLLAAVSCGGGDEEGTGGESADGDRAVAKGDAGPPPVSSARDLRGAVVRIDGFGDFGRDARSGERIVSASGSGFFVDPSGVALTNAHVVTGADDLEVYVGGEGRPRRAEVLGASECSDLAAIDVEGGGFPYLAFRDEEAEVDLPVEAAGFPGAGPDGRPAYSRTAGQITRARTDGVTDSVSLSYVVQHDALLEGGNSGGPLVDERGRTVGVNFGGPLDEEGNPTDQMWAVPAGEAEELLPALRRGEDVGYMGITPDAFFNPRTGAHGVLAQAVGEGSAAGDAGLRAGDVVVRLGERDLAAQGTMAEYCDVLRERGGGRAEGPFSIRVMRLGSDRGTGAYMEGEIGGESLRPTGEEIRVVLDDSETLAVWVPFGWQRTTGAPTRFPAARSRADFTVQASSDPERGFSIDAPGVALSASRDLAGRYTPEEFLDRWSFSGSCREARREPYDDGTFAGVVDRYSGCGRSGTENTVVVAKPEGGEYMAVVNVVATPDRAGAEARDTVLGSFRIAGEGPTP